METRFTHIACRLSAGLALAAASVTVAKAQAVYIDPGLSGTVATAEWASGSLANSNPSGAATSSNGFSDVVLAPIAPGYRASAGFYSFTGDFGAKLTATTEAAVQTVVFQLVMMQNPDFTLADSLNYNGGPVLSYFVGETKFDLNPVNAQVLNGPVFQGGGMFEGDLYSFGWTWDLSGIADVTSFEISAPIIVHSSTVQSRLDVQVVPEPSHYALAFSVVLCGIAVARRRKQRAA